MDFDETKREIENAGFNASKDKMVFCPVLGREIADGYCWQICNIGNNDALTPEDADKKIDWPSANEKCGQCEHNWE